MTVIIGAGKEVPPLRGWHESATSGESKEESIPREERNWTVTKVTLCQEQHIGNSLFSVFPREAIPTSIPSNNLKLSDKEWNRWENCLALQTFHLVPSPSAL